MAIDAGTSGEELMERAGAALAEAAVRFAGPLPALVLCGPGNNGGDGYVAARHLAQRGVSVRVAALAEPKSEGAKWARSGFDGEVEDLGEQTARAPLVIDCLFGTGLRKAVDQDIARIFGRLCDSASIRIACDVPSGVDSDSGALLNEVPDYDATVTFGALKPAHRLMPAMDTCGRVVLADIGIAAETDWREIAAPKFPPLDPSGHKYSRGLVHLLAGKMPGAIALAAAAAARSGAGYVRVSTSSSIDNITASVVHSDTAHLDDDFDALRWFALPASSLG